MKTLIGIDGSDSSFAAVTLAGQLLNPARDQVAFYHSCGDAAFPIEEADDSGIQERACHAIADVVFDEARKYLPEGLRDSLHSILGTERPAEELSEAADEWGAELIVVGARGLGPIESLLLGSVSSSVVRAANVPVLVVRHRQPILPDAVALANTELRVLLGYDRANAERQAKLLQSISWPESTVGCVMAVIESLLPSHLPEWVRTRARDADTEAMTAPWVQEHEQERQQKSAELTAFQQQLPEPFRTTPMVAEGNPAEQLLAALSRDRIDIAVVGKTVRNFFSRLLLGSTSEKILAHAPCSVLVAPR